jgi:hypothetical protein
MQELIPATPQSPQNDPIFETLAQLVDECPGTDCRQCSSYVKCIRWFDRRSGASVKPGGLTIKQLKKAMNKFNKELRPPVVGAFLFLYPTKSPFSDEGWHSFIVPVVVVVLTISVAGLYIVIRRRRHVSV